MVKIDGDLWFLKDDRLSSEKVNMARIYERLLSTSLLREKRWDSFHPQRVNPLGEDNICMVNLLETPKVIAFLYNMIDLLRLFQKRSFALSSEHENQNVATIGDTVRSIHVQL